MKTLQKFTKEYLEHCKTLSSDEIARFLEDFRILHGETHASKSKLISIKVPEDLLNAFKMKAKSRGTPYQTQIKALMKAWLIK